MSERKCVIHPDEPAYVTVQGISVCTPCFNTYNDERRMGDGRFQRRLFLRELIAASANRSENNPVNA